MRQKEVTDHDGITWTCVQAFSAGTAQVAEQAAALSDDGDGKVTVVCTPSGGQQSVRVKMAAGWEDNISDDALLQAIQAGH